MRHANKQPSLELTPFDLWGNSGWCNQEVVGESQYVADGWEAPSGWSPDPTWPPAPAGRQFWVME